MSADRWSVTLSISELSDGVSWRINRPSGTTGEVFWAFGSQRTAVARALTEAKVYEALKQTCSELTRSGQLPWLF